MADTGAKQETAGAKKKPRVQSPDDWVREASVLLGNATKDALITERLAKFGYTGPRMAEGQALLDALKELMLKQKEEYGQRYEATEVGGKAWSKADSAYTTSLKVARIALRDRRKARSAMMVDGPRDRSLSGWLKQATDFYGNLLKDEDALAAMSTFGYTVDSLKAEQTLVSGMSALDANSHKERGEAYGMTRERDKKLDELARWISDLRAIAKCALKDSPDKLRILGI